MPAEWIDPQYAELVDAMRREQHPEGDADRRGPGLVRGFIVPEVPQD